MRLLRFLTIICRIKFYMRSEECKYWLFGTYSILNLPKSYIILPATINVLFFNICHLRVNVSVVEYSNNDADLVLTCNDLHVC